MADDEGTSTSTDPDNPKADRKKQIKNEHVLIVVGIIGLILTLLFLRKASTANNAATAQTPNASPYDYQTNPCGYAADEYDDEVLAQDVSQLQSEITGLQTATPSTPAAPPTTTTPTTTPSSPTPSGLVEQLYGSGYGIADATEAQFGYPSVSYGGNEYQEVNTSGNPAYGAAPTPGEPLYYQPVEGVIDPISGITLSPGTPLFAKQ
jgi:cytoskeletal protein RodZ